MHWSNQEHGTEEARVARSAGGGSSLLRVELLDVTETPPPSNIAAAHGERFRFCAPCRGFAFGCSAKQYSVAQRCSLWILIILASVTLTDLVTVLNSFFCVSDGVVGLSEGPSNFVNVSSTYRPECGNFQRSLSFAAIAFTSALVGHTMITYELERFPLELLVISIPTFSAMAVSLYPSLHLLEGEDMQSIVMIGLGAAATLIYCVVVMSYMRGYMRRHLLHEKDRVQTIVTRFMVIPGAACICVVAFYLSSRDKLWTARVAVQEDIEHPSQRYCLLSSMGDVNGTGDYAFSYCTDAETSAVRTQHSSECDSVAETELAEFWAWHNITGVCQTFNTCNEWGVSSAHNNTWTTKTFCANVARKYWNTLWWEAVASECIVLAADWLLGCAALGISALYSLDPHMTFVLQRYLLAARSSDDPVGSGTVADCSNGKRGQCAYTVAASVTALSSQFNFLMFASLTLMTWVKLVNPTQTAPSYTAPLAIYHTSFFHGYFRQYLPLIDGGLIVTMAEFGYETLFLSIFALAVVVPVTAIVLRCHEERVLDRIANDLPPADCVAVPDVFRRLKDTPVAARARMAASTVLDHRFRVNSDAKQLIHLRRHVCTLLELLHQTAQMREFSSDRCQDAVATLCSPHKHVYDLAMLGIVHNPQFRKFVELADRLSKHLRRQALTSRSSSLESRHSDKLDRHAAATALIRRYSQAAKDKDVFDTLLHKLEETTGAKAHAADLKSVFRACEKLAMEQDANEQLGNPNRMFDIVRGALVFDDLDSMQLALHQLLSAALNLEPLAVEYLGDAVAPLRSPLPRLRLVRIKNRYSCPTEGGWSDLLLNLQVQTTHRGDRCDPAASFTNVCELQLVYKSLWQARRNLGGHRVYEQYRTAVEILARRGLTPESFLPQSASMEWLRVFEARHE